MKKLIHGIARIFYILLKTIGYSAYFLSAVGFVCVLVPLIVLLGIFPAAQYRFTRTTFAGFLFFLTRLLLPMLQVYAITEISGFEPKLSRGGIFISNHRGRLDALLLLSILKNTGVLIKSKYARFPLYRMFIKYLDFVAIDADSPAGFGAAMGQCIQLLQAGVNILVFPEGTRASSGRLLPFKPFVFKLAIDSGRPVFPVIIHSDCPFMAKRPGSIFPKITFHYTVRCLQAMHPVTAERPMDFAGRVRTRIAAELAPLDHGTVWEKGTIT